MRYIPATLYKPILALLVGIILSVTATATVNIIGNIRHHTSDSIKFTFSTSKLAFLPASFAALPDKYGNFSISIPHIPYQYTQVEMQYGNHLADLLLSPGDSLHLSIDADRFDSSQSYHGTGADVQNLLATHTLSRGRMNQYSLRLRNLLEKDTATFLQHLDKELQTEIDFLDRSPRKLSTSFRKYWIAFYQYYNYFFIQQYPIINQAIKLRRLTDTIPPENYAVLNHMPLAFDDNLINVPSYLMYLTAVFDIRLKAAQYAFPYTDTTNRRIFTDSVYTLAYNMLPPKSCEYFIAQNLYAAARVQPLEQTRSKFSTFKTKWPQSPYMVLLNSQISIAERLAPGMPAPDIDLTLMNGQVQHIYDYQDTVILLAFWATWCKQCVGEMRLLQKNTMPIFNGKPVKFVFVSLDTDTASVNRLIDHFKMPGTYAMTDGSWYSTEAKAYGVQKLPAYYLIDKKGKFAHQRPPSPQAATDLIVAISRLY